ncbi:hypothetical protein ATK30_8285 [Amycolatopsis echigonensis]|uniref:Uncharacterized protein n=1 Tax=Amycolatopsis echigonensis TaxID=2576905 RepID=A0A2N3WTW8_9PSEU|nr:hypothetical protein ATK30_8285 [Amycolatopsis niigatensis]
MRPFNRAVLRNALGRNNRSEGLALMYELARLPARERQRLIDIAEFMREMPPRLPDDPTSEQVDGWVELAELVSDDDFRRATRQMVLRGETDNRIEFGLNIRPTVLEHARPAAEQGIAPGSDAGHVILDRIVPADLGDAEAQALLDWPRTGKDYCRTARRRGEAEVVSPLPMTRQLHGVGDEPGGASARFAVDGSRSPSPACPWCELAPRRPARATTADAPQPSPDSPATPPASRPSSTGRGSSAPCRRGPGRTSRRCESPRSASR